MSALTRIQELGLQASVTAEGHLRLKGLSSLEAGAKEDIISFCRKNKMAIIQALTQTGKAGECEACPAAGYWDYAQYAGQGLFCFHFAYFKGKPGTPKPCTEMRTRCPRITTP